MIFGLIVSAALVSLTAGESVAESLAKVPKYFKFDIKEDIKWKISGTFNGVALQSAYLGDTSDGYSNPKFDHCVILDCVKEERCTDFARFSQDHNGEDTECTFRHYTVDDACWMDTRLNTYDYYYQWWVTVDPRVVDYVLVQCNAKY